MVSVANWYPHRSGPALSDYRIAFAEGEGSHMGSALMVQMMTSLSFILIHAMTADAGPAVKVVDCGNSALPLPRPLNRH